MPACYCLPAAAPLLPGALRPAGPHHSNDHARFEDIRIIPPVDELLCQEEPYLPVNR